MLVHVRRRIGLHCGEPDDPVYTEKLEQALKMAPAAPPPREQIELLGSIQRLLLAAVVEHYLHGAEDDGTQPGSRWQPVQRGPGGKPLEDGKTRPVKNKQKKKKPSRKEAKRIAAVQVASQAARSRIDAADGNAVTLK